MSLKRFVKLLGIIVMALLVLTEENPPEAIKALARRCAFVLLPFSILLIKYFPEFGVSYGEWSGARMVRGVAEDKNMLGQMCLALSLLLIWHIIEDLKKGDHKSNKMGFVAIIYLLALSCHLLILSDSATSLVCVIIGTAIFFCSWSRSY